MDLTGKAGEIFLDTVSGLKEGHFQPADLPLLVEYCRSAALAAQAHTGLAEGAVLGGRVSPWLTVLEKAQRAMAQLSLRLRLGPQGRSPTIPTRPPAGVSYFERTRLLEARNDTAEDGN